MENTEKLPLQNDEVTENLDKNLQSDKCDKNNPNDPHYGEAGEYNQSCVWIADIGK